MALQGGAYLSSGKFKCLFDNQDFVSYLRSSDGSSIGKMRCFDGQATIIAEAKEFDREQAFVTVLKDTASPALFALAHASLALIPPKRFDLSADGVAAFQKIGRVSSQNCRDLFASPTKLQAVCMDQGTPLAGATVISDIWKAVAASDVDMTMTQVAPLLTEYLCNVCISLKLLLDLGIVHGDVKTNNVLLYPDPHPIRRYELTKEVGERESPTDVVGRRLRYRLIDFGKHQPLDRFLKGGFRAFTRRNMRAWYNPLPLGFALLDGDASASVLNNKELNIWLPKLAMQIDKYAFMYILWELAYSSNVQGSQSKEWDADAFSTSILNLIAACSRPAPRVPKQALDRVRRESWLEKVDFRKYMLHNGFVWFTTWDEIYAQVWTWGSKWNPQIAVPQTLRALATFASPALDIQTL